ncbi:MAG: hypothetical protein V4736_09045 [Bdellovibrionota bacterium]
MINKLLILIIFSFSVTSFAEEKAAEGAADQKPAPITSQQELLNLQTRVQTLAAKLKLRTDQIDKLRKESDETPDKSKKSEIANQMALEYKEYQKETKDYNEALYQLNYQYPETASTKMSDDKVKEIKTLKQLEEEQSLEGKIKKNMKTIRKHYGKKEAKPKVEIPAPLTAEPVPVQDPLLAPVIIRK